MVGSPLPPTMAGVGDNDSQAGGTSLWMYPVIGLGLAAFLGFEVLHWWGAAKRGEL